MEKPITLHVCVRKEAKGTISRVFISKDDYHKSLQYGYPISVVDNKEYYVPNSENLYEHHYELRSFSYPKEAKIMISSTPFVYNAQVVKSMIKTK